MKTFLRAAGIILFGVAAAITVGASTAHAGGRAGEVPVTVTVAWNTTSTTAAPTTTEVTTTTTTTTTTTVPTTTAAPTTAATPPEATVIVSRPPSHRGALPETGTEIPWVWILPTLALGAVLILLSRSTSPRVR
jgi:hypothetical protein